MINFKVLVSLILIFILLITLSFFVIDSEGNPYEVEEISGKGWSQWQLPKKFRELSGLAYLPGLLVTHTDEKGRVYIFDPADRHIKEWFRLGPKTVKDDFEGIAFLGKDLYLLASTGLLYQVRNALNLKIGSLVEPDIVDTQLIDECEFEGLATIQQKLLLLCKTNYMKEDQGYLVVWSWSATSGEVESFLRLPLANIIKKAKIKRLRPSAIDYYEEKIYVLAGPERLLIEIEKNQISAAFKLKKKRHRKAEGISFVEGGGFYLADEGVGKKGKGGGMITRYQNLDYLLRL